MYKLLEMLIYNRMMSIINVTIPNKQTGFSRSFCDRVLSLATHIEAGFDMGKKTAVTFIGLTAVYNTV